MNPDQGIFVPLILGIVEGLTEFLPVSSTAHILLLGEWLGFTNPGNSFEVLIQLGAILAIITIYFGKLLQLVLDFFKGEKYALRFAAGVLLASVPAALAGVLLHGYIKSVLYNAPLVICIMLITGGIILIVVDRLKLEPKYDDIYHYPLKLCFGIGIFQMLALVPGVSRSGATIVGSMLMGTDKRSAAEFTFFIALPIMTGAFAYDLYKNIDVITLDAGLDIAVGFAAAFIVGAIVVRYLLDFVSKFGFSIFGWWRIIAGILGLIFVVQF
ncbi:undecaprenyl-diphosphatase [Maritalea mobilis]|uniref:Undecaprenyl-diphosphatase n=1 Tax=Maritalea mobilis TaxID=483324 RepID=A0A4R6VLY3_9HYPH|nr:undecaprenyl-diphosphate phosphatase [Maritalea mobilis]TDQ64535.1 undecaprenyl-diphosphatase [Maritalea mobilis]